MSDQEFLKNLSFQSVVHEVDVYGLILIDLSGNIASWNRGASKLLGYEKHEVLGRNFEFIFTPEDRSHDVPRQEMEAASDRGYCYDDRWHLRKDGTRLGTSAVSSTRREKVRSRAPRSRAAQSKHPGS